MLIYESPLGHLQLNAAKGFLTGCRITSDCLPAESFGEIKEEDREILSMASRWLDEYFSGRNPDFKIPVRAEGSDFRRQVWAGINSVPYGNTKSYKDLSLSIGRPGASRAVANACGCNPVIIFIPCHRIIRSDGSAGGYTPSPAIKEFLLSLEGRR